VKKRRKSKQKPSGGRPRGRHRRSHPGPGSRLAIIRPPVVTKLRTDPGSRLADVREGGWRLRCEIGESHLGCGWRSLVRTGAWPECAFCSGHLAVFASDATLRTFRIWVTTGSGRRLCRTRRRHPQRRRWLSSSRRRRPPAASIGLSGRAISLLPSSALSQGVGIAVLRDGGTRVMVRCEKLRISQQSDNRTG
jgi:hypothetical protein